MKAEDKIRFVENLTDSIAHEVIEKVKKGNIPKHWDGHELRLLLAEKFMFEVTDWMQDGRHSRVKAFRNDCYNRNI